MNATGGEALQERGAFLQVLLVFYSVLWCSRIGKRAFLSKCSRITQTKGKYSVNPSQDMTRPRLARNIDTVPLPARQMHSSSLFAVRGIHAVRPAADIGSRDASPQALRGVHHDGGGLLLGQTVPGDLLYWKRLRQLVFPLVCHLPGEEGGEI